MTDLDKHFHRAQFRLSGRKRPVQATPLPLGFTPALTSIETPTNAQRLDAYRLKRMALAPRVEPGWWESQVIREIEAVRKMREAA